MDVTVIIDGVKEALNDLTAYRANELDVRSASLVEET